MRAYKTLLIVPLHKLLRLLKLTKPLDETSPLSPSIQAVVLKRQQPKDKRNKKVIYFNCLQNHKKERAPNIKKRKKKKKKKKRSLNMVFMVLLSYRYLVQAKHLDHKMVFLLLGHLQLLPLQYNTLPYNLLQLQYKQIIYEVRIHPVEKKR